MIEELYQDKLTATDRLLPEGTVNPTHPWWVKFTNGSTRPATDTEVELWQLAQGFKDNYAGACKNYWDTYCAGTGKTIDSFDGIAAKTPEEEVRQHRLSLEKQVASLTRELESRKEY